MNSTFISSADIYEFEFTGDVDSIKESARHRTTAQDIALHLANLSESGHKIAIQCCGGCQVFKSVKDGLKWEKDEF